MLTKEEYLKALDYIEEETTVIEDYETMPFITCNHLQKEIAILRQLIHEHFDNPPLTLDELNEMQNEPIWDDWAKEWLIFNWNCDSLECLLCRDSLGNWLHLDFEENRFYRKQVQEDE